MKVAWLQARALSWALVYELSEGRACVVVSLSHPITGEKWVLSGCPRNSLMKSEFVRFVHCSWEARPWFHSLPLGRL